MDELEFLKKYLKDYNPERGPASELNADNSVEILPSDLEDPESTVADLEIPPDYSPLQVAAKSFSIGGRSEAPPNIKDYPPVDMSTRRKLVPQEEPDGSTIAVSMEPSTRAQSQYNDIIQKQFKYIDGRQNEERSKYNDLLKERTAIDAPKINPWDQILGAMVPLAVAALGGEAGALSQPKAFENYQGYLKSDLKQKETSYERQRKDNDLKLKNLYSSINKLQSKRDYLETDAAFKIQQMEDTNKFRNENMDFKKEQANKPKVPKSTAPNTNQIFKNETTLRKEFNSLQLVKDYQQVKVAVEKIKSGAFGKTGADDIALITAFSKMIDPSTGVKEGEFANAANAAGWRRKMEAAFERINSGQMLEDSVRQEFIDASKRAYAPYKKAFIEKQSFYKNLAEQQSMNPENIVGQMEQADKTQLELLKEEQARRQKVSP